MKSFALFFIVLFIISCLPVTIHSQEPKSTEVVATTSSTQTALIPDEATEVVAPPTSVTVTSVTNTFSSTTTGTTTTTGTHTGTGTSTSSPTASAAAVPMRHDMTNIAGACVVAAAIALF
ncbi:9994_t:CDS:2 [Funneliformis mosseae]|uniref:9994_t:CDS:1 n=1 Tax=Funneliformis mosseae TaxID=27381 RepID=A0A9N8V5J1_FUNMO|nr:9994_t:CDS:2 [Funneliformis mosseae]